jgi:hypothetical protein
MEKIDPDVRISLAAFATPLTTTELDMVANLTAPEQISVVNRARESGQTIKEVATVVRGSDLPKAAPSPMSKNELNFLRLFNAWKMADRRARRQFVEKCADEIRELLPQLADMEIAGQQAQITLERR